MSELVVDGLTVRFAGLTALDGVGFTVAEGSVHAVIGPNGAGKSTCFNVLSGVYRASSGQRPVRRRGADRAAAAPDRGLGVARTFQNIALSRHLSVEDNLMLGRHRLTKASPRRGCGCRGRAARTPGTGRGSATSPGSSGSMSICLAPVGLLSYGVQKRIELARALAMEPRLLLLDEPVAGMNGAERKRMAEVIRRVRADLGVSVLLVEHDMGMVMRLADEVTVLNFGRRIAWRARAGAAGPGRDPRLPRRRARVRGTFGGSP